MSSLFDIWYPSGIEYEAELRLRSNQERLAELSVHTIMQAERILDLGCGTGMVGRVLRRAGWKGWLEGVDGSASMLEIACRGDAYNVCARGAIIESLLSHQPGSFDVCCLWGVLPHFWPVEVSALLTILRKVATYGLLVTIDEIDPLVSLLNLQDTCPMVNHLRHPDILEWPKIRLLHRSPGYLTWKDCDLTWTRTSVCWLPIS